ncbi:MAG: glycosyltransferase family 2 protein [Pirellulaceae bacterium]
MPFVSILIPVYNEAHSLPQLLDELHAVSRTRAIDMEVVVVDDGSTDETWSTIKKLASQHAQLIGLKLTKNFGKSAALAAAVDNSRHDLIVTIDGDLQDDPQEIPRLLDELAQDHDVVVGWKQKRQDRISKRFLSRGFNFFVGTCSRVWLHDHNSGFKAFRRDVFRDVDLAPGMHRFLPILAAKNGFRVAEIPVHHRPRLHGRSKYGWKRIPEAMIDLVGVAFWRKGRIDRSKPPQRYEICERTDQGERQGP